MSSTSFNNKVIALTGAAQGIGLATATLLASRGASLSLADVQTQTLEQAKKSILAAHPSVKILTSTVDVRDAVQVEAWIRDTVSHFGRLDGAANIAGVVPKSIGSEAGLMENVDAGEWDLAMAVNVTGVMHCMKYQLREMGEGASLVNVSSIAGLMGRAKNGIYTATKHAVIGLTRSAAKEVGARGVRVNAICPGRIETPMLLKAMQAASEAGTSQVFEQETLNDIALRRKGKPEEVAKLIGFLLSDESSYISGNAVSVDGGWNC